MTLTQVTFPVTFFENDYAVLFMCAAGSHEFHNDGCAGGPEAAQADAALLKLRAGNAWGTVPLMAAK